MTQKTNRMLQNLAIHLFWNLHSGAGENIISSLLAASINQSGAFRDWFLDQIHYGRKRRVQLYALPNMSIGDSVVRTIRQTNRFGRNEKFPRQPDIVLFDATDKKEWNKLRTGRTNRERANALRSVRLVVVEVKHTTLKSGDKKKYYNLIEGLASYNRRNKEALLKRHRFVILSSHTNAAKDSIVSKKDRNPEEQLWYEFFRSTYDGVAHLTPETIYTQIHDNPAWSKGCAILRLFEYYLALYSGTPHADRELHREYWSETIKTSNTEFDLKWSIADHINWLAGNASAKTARGEQRKWHENEVRRLRSIDFTPDERYRRRVQFEYNSERSTSRLDITLDGVTDSLDTEEMKRSEDCGKLIRTLEKIVRFLES